MTTPVNPVARTAAARSSVDDPSYRPFLAAVRDTFFLAAERTTALFTVDTTGLWDLYLEAFPAAQRQTYNCSACRHFIERYGGLVTIASDGCRLSAVWENADIVDSPFVSVAHRMRDEVESRFVVGAFVAHAGTLGTPQTGDWSHLAAEFPTRLAHTDRLLTPGQRAAAIRENVNTVARALGEFSLDALNEALRILEADALSRAEKFVGPVRWLIDLHARRAAYKDERRRAAILWHAVATAPEGYSHPRASVIGPLLEGIAAGKSYETLRAEFAEMLHPLKYQRPTAAPSAGNIAQAEKIVEQLGIARSLERRFARLHECQTIWTPKRAHADANVANVGAQGTAGGVFAHLTPKEAAPATTVRGVVLPPQTMTWEKFARTVLATADAIDLDVPSHGNFMALVTATHADAPPIIRWDREDARNPVTHYVYHKGSPASRWNLRGIAWHPVTGIVPHPNTWGTAPQPQHGEGLLLVLRGAVDQDVTELALFPETLRDDLRAIRSTIEAFSKAGSITGAEDASACGYGIGRGQCGIRLRVTVAGRSSEYRIDRWD
jgi:hypothetical protein